MARTTRDVGCPMTFCRICACNTCSAYNTQRTSAQAAHSALELEFGRSAPARRQKRQEIKQELLSDLRRQVRPQLGERVLLELRIRDLPQVRLAHFTNISQPLLEVRRLQQVRLLRRRLLLGRRLEGAITDLALRGASRSLDAVRMASESKINHPRPPLLETTRVDGVKEPPHRGTPRSYQAASEHPEAVLVLVLGGEAHQRAG